MDTETTTTFTSATGDASSAGGYNPSTFTMNNDEAPPGMSFADLPNQGNYGVAANNNIITEHDEEYAAGDGEQDFLEDLRKQEKIPSSNTVTNSNSATKTDTFTTHSTAFQSSQTTTPTEWVGPDEKDTPLSPMEQPSKSGANKAKPFYQKPWFWILAVVIVVAIVVVVVVVATSGGGGGSDSDSDGIEQNNPSNPSSPSFPTRAPAPILAPTSPTQDNIGQPTEPTGTEQPTVAPTDPPVQLPSCTFDNDCPLFACALETWSLTADVVCCPTGFRTGLVNSPNYETSFVSRYYCKDQANGKPCYNSDMCASGACVGNVCQETLLQDSETCSQNSDCQSNACGYSNYTMEGEIVCCPSGSTITEYYRPNGVFQTATYCTGQPIGAACYNHAFCESQACVMNQCAANLAMADEACATNTDCLDNVCAYQSYTQAAPRVCCGSKDSTSTVYRPNGDIDSQYYCTGQGLTSPCATNPMCESNACVMGQCESDLRIANEACASDSDCQNSECGYQFYTVDASKVCCESNSKVRYVYRPNGDIDSEYYCAGQALNATCTLNQMCESGACVMNQCEPDLRMVNEVCLQDSDCQNSQCGWKTYEMSSEKVCCESGSTVDYVFRPNGDIGSEDYCTNQAVGDACGSNGMCASGICSAGLCASSA